MWILFVLLENRLCIDDPHISYIVDSLDVQHTYDLDPFSVRGKEREGNHTREGEKQRIKRSIFQTIRTGYDKYNYNNRRTVLTITTECCIWPTFEFGFAMGTRETILMV